MNGWMDVGYVLLMFFFISLAFSFVGYVIHLIVFGCCDELMGNNTDATVSTIAASLNDRMYRQESRYRFRYDTPYESHTHGASFREVRDDDVELPIYNYRYGYPLPSAPEHPDVSPFSRAASYRSGHSTSYTSRQGSVRLQTAEEERDILPSPSKSISIKVSEDPPPSYNEVVGKE